MAEGIIVPQSKSLRNLEAPQRDADHSDPEVSLGLEDFCDQRVFAVSDTYCDKNTARVYGPDNFDAHQPHDGPSYIVVGSHVSDERLMRHLEMLGERYGATLQQLQEARSGNLVRIR